MKKWKRALSILLGISLLLAACGASIGRTFEAQVEGLGDESSAPFEPASVRGEAEEAAFDMDTGVVQTSAQTGVDIPGEPLIIRTGSLSLVVPDTEAAVEDISGMVGGMGGWVLESNVYSSGQAKRGNMTVRVPVARFIEAMDRMKELAIEVESESTSGQDVTEEYVDLAARLTNLEATRDRVRAFLDEAKEVEDALAVNRELSRLESEIEQIKGRMQYLSQSASFSTISVSLTPDVLSQPIEIAGWRPSGIAKDAVEDLVNALQSIGTFLIRFFIAVFPILLIILIPTYLVYRLLRAGIRRFRRRQSAAAEAPAEAEEPAPPAES